MTENTQLPEPEPRREESAPTLSPNRGSIRQANAMNEDRSTSHGTAAAAACAFAAASEAAVSDLEKNVPTGMGPLEQALAARIRHALAQLRACAEQLEGDGLMVAGSMGQRRPHPLLKSAQDMRKEISDGLKDLCFRADQRALFLVAKALTTHYTGDDIENGEPS
jgi:hypothetical protein